MRITMLVCHIVNSSIREAVILMLLLLNFSSVSAQNAGPARFWAITGQVGMCHSSVTDKRFSALPFSGIQPQCVAAITFQKARSRQKLSGLYHTGPLNPSYVSVRSRQRYFAADYSFLYSFRKTAAQRLRFEGGARLGFLYNKRTMTGFSNVRATSEAAATLSGLIAVAYLLPRQLFQITISNEVQLPAASLVARPPFGGGAQKGLLEHISLQSPAQFLNLADEFSMRKPVGERSAVALLYGWQYYKIKAAPAVQQATHSFCIAYSYQL